MALNVECAVLFARRDSIYKTLPGCDVYDIDRDATSYRGGVPVVAHPPCRSWGNLSHFAKPRPGERELAFFAVDQVRRCGGVLEHPVTSKLWKEADLPAAGRIDNWGGFTMVIDQHWFGHLARKRTLLYICGINPGKVPAFPFCMAQPEYMLGTCKKGFYKELPKSHREATPIELAIWLVELAKLCTRAKAVA